PGEITMTPVHEAVLSALDGGGALFFRAIADRVVARFTDSATDPTIPQASPAGGSGGSAPGASPAGGSGGSAPGASPAGGSGGSAPRASPAGGSGGSAPRASTAAERIRVLNRVSDQAVAAAMWDLVWAGLLTNDTLAPLRTVLGSGRALTQARQQSSAELASGGGDGH